MGATREKGIIFLMACKKKNLLLILSDDRKMPTLGSTTPVGNSASFPTVKLDPWVGNFLSPLNLSSGFYLSNPEN